MTRSCRGVLAGRDRWDESGRLHGVSRRPWIVDDDLWALIEPLSPAWTDKAPGPRPAPDRLCLQGIRYVLHNDIAWQLLPHELGFGSGRTTRAARPGRPSGLRQSW
ncbi:transposase [Streptomyces sp. NPDC059970]|uniref:transposase n=1 Tax=Streptomyces sp. NPDC059970 TaxID=3347019 RepID=UPI0036C646BD